MTFVHYLGAAIVFLMAVAALSRILTMQQVADYIRNAFDGVANLFKGAFS